MARTAKEKFGKAIGGFGFRAERCRFFPPVVPRAASVWLATNHGDGGGSNARQRFFPWGGGLAHQVNSRSPVRARSPFSAITGSDVTSSNCLSGVGPGVPRCFRIDKGLRPETFHWKEGVPPHLCQMLGDVFVVGRQACTHRFVHFPP